MLDDGMFPCLLAASFPHNIAWRQGYLRYVESPRALVSLSPGGATWRVCLDIVHEPGLSLSLELTSDLILGRVAGQSAHIDLVPYGAWDLGVAQRHALLRPARAGVYVMDFSSTNGTYLNGHRLIELTPFLLHHGDIISLGRLQFVIHTIRRGIPPYENGGESN